MYCIYIHERASDGRAFYVGKGKLKRPYSRVGRSQRWHRIVAKHGLVCRIIKSNMPEPCAFSLERVLIAAIGRQNLCNMTDGGEGTSGRIPSKEQRQKCARANKGVKPSPHSINLARQRNSKPVGTRCGLVFASVTDAAKFVKPDNWRAAKVAISSCANGNERHSYGYEWGFIVDGHPHFKYVSKMSLPRPLRWRAVQCSNGMKFDAVAHAVQWLKSVGYQKASSGAICRSGNSGKACYGLWWQYV